MGRIGLTMSLRHALRLAPVLTLGLAALAAHADWRPDGGFVEVGSSPHDSRSLTAGLTWRGNWRKEGLGSELTGSVELFASHWQWDSRGGGTSQGTVLGVVPLARLRFDHGRSPWFAEGGIGLVLGDKRYVTPQKTFSTDWNFYDVLALGYSFGAQRSQELSLRFTHTSNAGIKQPNPGENFWQLRWAMRF
jgi:hypothetical protein